MQRLLCKVYLVIIHLEIKLPLKNLNLFGIDETTLDRRNTPFSNGIDYFAVVVNAVNYFLYYLK